VVRVVGGRAQAPQFVAVDVLRWHRVALDVSAMTQLDEIEQGAEGACAQLPEGVDGHVVRLTLVGRGPLHAELKREGVGGLEEHLRETFGARLPRVALESVRDETLPELDMDRLRQGGLTGAVFEAAADPGALQAALKDPDWVRLERWLRACGVRGPREDGSALIQEAARGVAEALADGDA
jgi:hypothetical protein